MSVKDPDKKNLLMVITVGEGYVFETLDAIVKETSVPYKLQIWYGVEGKMDHVFYEKLLSYTDDVIVAKKSHPWTSAQGWAMIYNDYDYLWVFGADAKPLPGYTDLVDHAFGILPFTVCVGNPKFAINANFAISQVGSSPDLLVVYDRSMVNVLGALNPSFHYNGHELLEYMHRIVHDRFQFVAIKGLVEELGPSNPNKNVVDKEYNPENWKVLVKAQKLLNHSVPYAWWSNRLLDMADPV